MLSAAIASRDADKDPVLFSALHDAVCAIANRWCDPGLVADLVHSCWDAGGVTLTDLCMGGCRTAAGRLCRAVTTSPAPEELRAGLLVWLCRQGLCDPRSALMGSTIGQPGCVRRWRGC